MRCFKDNPAVAEADVSSSQMMDGGNDDGINDKFNTVLVQILKDFLGMFRHWRRDRDRGGGRFKAEDKNAYDVVMADISGRDMNYDKLERYLSRELQVSYRQVKRGKELRKDLEDMDS